MARKHRNKRFIQYCIGLYATSLCVSPAHAALPVKNFNALYRAASNRRIEVISNAIARGMDIDSTDFRGNTGLCVAIQNNDPVAYQVFLHFGANPNHSCILRIPRSQYSSFIRSMHPSMNEYSSASARYANIPVQNRNIPQRTNLYSSSWLSSPITWTIGGVAVIAGGIALAGGGGGKGGSSVYISSNNSGGESGGDDDEHPTPEIDFDFSTLNGVGGKPTTNTTNKSVTVSEQETSQQSDLWAIYANQNRDIINKADLTVTTAEDSENTEHWGGIYAKNGYIFNAGVITVQSENYYAAGLMACVVNSYNPANTACFVNANDTSTGDIYNYDTGKINVTANQSSGIFSSGTDSGKVTNAGEINMIGTDNTGIFVYGNSDGVINNGSITMQGGGSDYLAGSMNGIWVAETADITNNGNITISNLSYTANGMYNKDGTISNKGTITIEGSGAALKSHQGTLNNEGVVNIINNGSETAYGMKLDYSGISNNKGTINIDGNGYGMYMTSGTQTNENSGIITLSNGSGYGMGGNGISTNNGEIRSSGGGMLGNNLTNNNLIESADKAMNTSGQATNNGTLQTQSIGMFSEQENSNLNNTGTIEAAIGIQNDYGTTENSGTINGSINGISNIKGNITNSGTIQSRLGTAIETAQSTINNAENALIASNSDRAITAQTKEITIDENTTKTYVSELTINNEGTIQLNNGGTAIEVSGNENDNAKLNLNNTGKIIVTNQNKAGFLSAVSSIAANSDTTISNTGDIIINNQSSNINNKITGMEIAKGTITNDGLFQIDNGYFNTDGDSTRDKRVIGIKIGEGEAVNNGEIIINSNNAIGMLAEYTKGGELNDNEVKARVTNNGTIEMNGTNNIAMYANNKGSVVTNAGTIIIKKPNLTDIYQKYGDTAYDETDSCNSFICLENGGTYINSGVVESNAPVNFNKINGRTLLSAGSRFSAPSISGTVYANYDLVTGNFENVIETDDNSFEGNTEQLEVRSLSPLFTANLLRSNQTLQSHIMLQRRNFNEFTDNTSAAEYLEKNYSQGNNKKFFDDLKISENKNNLTQKINEELGLKLFPSFAKQDIDTLKLVNNDISESILNDSRNDNIRSQIGINTHYRKQDKTTDQDGFEDKIQSVFGVVDKKYSTNTRLGLGLNYTRSDSKYEHNSKRKNNLIQIFAPFVYQDALYQFMSTPRIGMLWGDYNRRTDTDDYHGHTKEIYYGITNELRRDIAFEEFILEPKVEFNIAGLYMDKIKDHNLEIDDHNDISAELGIGLYLKKAYQFSDQSNLTIRAGRSTYLEVLNPYRRLRGELAGMTGSYRLNKTSQSRYHSILKTSVAYKKKQINLIGELEKYIEDTDGYEVNLKMKYDL